MHLHTSKLLRSCATSTTFNQSRLRNNRTPPHASGSSMSPQRFSNHGDDEHGNNDLRRQVDERLPGQRDADSEDTDGGGGGDGGGGYAQVRRARVNHALNHAHKEELVVRRVLSNLQRHDVDYDTSNMDDRELNELLSRLCR